MSDVVRTSCSAIPLMRGDHRNVGGYATAVLDEKLGSGMKRLRADAPSQAAERDRHDSSLALCPTFRRCLRTVCFSLRKEGRVMCRMCKKGRPQDHGSARRSSRRDFLKASAATGAAPD